NSGQKAGQAELYLARQLRQTGVLVIAVEKTDTIPSRISYYRNLGISSVDNVDTVPGRLALVLLLEGSTGHYGIKPTASSLLPGNSLLLPGG
ncbi:MAG: copper transporter, partial [Clostridia bacterium]|nr:copper transporter [Clostridia bacterium]